MLGVLALSAAWLLVFDRHAALASDTCRDLLYARDLAEGRLLHLAGVPASLGGLEQGALFPALMGLGVALHAPLGGVRAALLALFVASVAVLFAGARRRLGTPAAFVAAALWVGLGPLAVALGVLDNPNLLALPLVILTLTLLDLGDDGGALPAAAAGAALGLSILSHVDAAILLPVLVLGLLWGRRPAVGLAAGLLALAATVALLSPGMALQDLRRGTTEASLAAAAAVLVGVVAVGLGTRRAARRWDPGRRGHLLLWSAVGLEAGALGLLWALGGRAPTWRYLAPALPAACLLAGAGVARLTRGARPVWAGAGGVLGLALAAALTGPPRTPVPTLAAVPAVLSRLADLGYGPAGLRLRLRSALRQPLLACATALVPPRPGPPPGDDLALVAVPSPGPGALAAQTRPLGPTGLRVRRYAPWLDQVHPRICVTGAAGHRCLQTAWDGAPRRSPGAPLWDAAYPVLPGVAALVRDAGSPATSATVTFPLRVPAGGGVRTLRLRPDRAARRCGFRIARVTGVTPRSPLPATRVRLSGRPGQTGVLTVSVRLGAGRCDAVAARLGVPPSIVELRGAATP